MVDRYTRFKKDITTKLSADAIARAPIDMLQQQGNYSQYAGDVRKFCSQVNECFFVTVFPDLGDFTVLNELTEQEAHSVGLMSDVKFESLLRATVCPEIRAVLALNRVRGGIGTWEYLNRNYNTNYGE